MYLVSKETNNEFHYEWKNAGQNLVPEKEIWKLSKRRREKEGWRIPKSYFTCSQIGPCPNHSTMLLNRHWPNRGCYLAAKYRSGELFVGEF